jgi:hypothetical protein
MDELQENLRERLILLKRQIKQMYPELSGRLKEEPLLEDQEKRKTKYRIRNDE